MAPRKKEDFKEMQETSRKKILMAALELFAQKGYSATSVESISIKAKISKGLVYHYFKSKQDILKGIFGLLMKEGDQLLNWSKQLPHDQFIKGMIDYSFDYITHKTKLNRLVIAMTVQPEVVKGLKEEFDKAREIWMGRLTEIFKTLEYEHPEAEAYLMGAIFDGVGIGYLAMGASYPIDKVKDLVKKRYKL